MSIFSKFILKKITVFLSLFCAVFVAVFSATNLSVSAEAGQTGLDSAYVDMADPGPVYALFGMDLTPYAGMIPSLVTNFELLNESDELCGTPILASLLAMFYDIANQFVELEFSSVNCPNSTSPARLKFIDPGNSSIYDIVDILDVSEIGAGGGGELEDWGSTTGNDHQVIVDVSFENWEEYPIYVFGIYGESGEGDPSGYTSVSAPGTVSIYVPHVEGQDYITIVAAWWDSPDLDMELDPVMIGFSDPVLIDGSGPTSIEILLEENIDGGGGNDGPQIGNVSYSNITGTSVDLSSEIISLADRTITRRGFILDRLSDNFTINVSEDSMSGFGTGVYSLSALNLDCGTNYNVHPFIMDSTYSEWHGSTVNFTTASCGGGGGSNVNYDVYVRMGDEYEWDDVEGASVNFGAYSCETNDGGWCAVSDVVPGSYTITVTADYYEDYSAENVTIDSNNRSYIAYMTPNSIGSLSGLITDENSDGIDGVTVFSILFDSDTAPFSPTTTSGGGHFSFSDLYEGGGHFVMAAKDGYVGQYIGPGDLLMSNDNSHYDMQLDTATSLNSGSVSGVLTVDDVPVPSVKVLVFTFGDDLGWPEVLGFGFGETDVLGEYVVNGLAPADSYMVLFVEDFVDYESVGMHFASVTAGQDTGLDYNILVPEVNTEAASSISTEDATLNGSIGDTYEVNEIGFSDFENIEDLGFEYGTVVGGDFTNESQWTHENDDTGEFYTVINNLNCGTEYKYRAFASTAAGMGYGETMYFTTSSCGGGSTSASTNGSSNVTKDSVTLSGSFNVGSGDVVTRRGFQYGTDIAYGSSVFEDGNWNSGSSYSLNVSGTLPCGTTHHFRSYVTLSNFMTYYGSDMTFSTVSCDDGGGDEGGLVGAYVDGSDFSTVYALFGSDLSGFSEMIPMLNSNFELLNVNDVSCGAASSASLMATFYDVQNRFVQLGFSSINCPESTSPVKLKFTDPGDPSKYQLIDLQDVSDIGGGGTTADWSTQTGDDHFTVVTVAYEDWVQYPIAVVGWYADSVESVGGDPDGFVAISSPGIATLYIPHEEGADYVVLAALWWDNAEMDGDPSLIGFYDTPISIDGPGTTSIAIDLGETGGGNAVTAAQAAGTLVCEFVDSDWQSLSSLNVSTSPLSYDPVSPIYANSVLGNDSSYILIANPTSNPTWTLSVAPTDGEDALWSDGDGNYADFNDSDTGDDDDLDGFGGRLSINPVPGTLFTYSLDYSNDGISLGSSASFADGSVNSITLLTADEFSDAPGYWGFKNIGIHQIFPAGQDVGTYTFDLTISVI